MYNNIIVQTKNESICTVHVYNYHVCKLTVKLIMHTMHMIYICFHTKLYSTKDHSIPLSLSICTFLIHTI